MFNEDQPKPTIITLDSIQEFYQHTEPLPEGWKPTIDDVELYEIDDTSLEMADDFFRPIMKQTAKVSKFLKGIDKSLLSSDVKEAFDRVRKTGMVAMNATEIIKEKDKLQTELTKSVIAVIRHPQTHQPIAMRVFALFEGDETPEAAAALCVSPNYQRGYGDDRTGKGLGLGTLIFRKTHQHLTKVHGINSYIVGLTEASRNLLEKEPGISVEPAYPYRPDSNKFKVTIEADYK